MLLKKGLSIFAALVLIVGVLGNPVSAAKDSLDKDFYKPTPEQKELMDGFNQGQKEQATVLMNGLDGYTNTNGNVQIQIKNKSELKNQLHSVGGDDISFDELEKAVAQINYTFANDGAGNQINGLSCGSLVTIFGWIHTSNYALAAAALGITGWGAAVPAVLLAAVWAAAGVIGCELKG